MLPEHDMHIPPAEPQDEQVCEVYARHAPPVVQQPFGQVCASQAHAPVVLSQSPFEQLAQAAPPVPHELPD